MDGAEDDRVYFQEEHCPEEGYEVFVVSLADASPNPRTVVVEPLDAAAAGTAMDGPRRPVDVASGTILHLGQSTIHDVEVLRPQVIGHQIRFPPIRLVQEHL